jgi:circadian clock protein KaiC
MKTSQRATRRPLTLPKAPTGIRGLDEITHGGLPRGRPTLICGAAGCGKTVLALEFLVRGATEFGEPGVFMAFEESGRELIANVRSLGFDLGELVGRRRISLDHVRIERSEIQETGEYNLEGLFVRLEHAVRSVGAKRVVLDTVEALFASLPNEMILRSELRRLFRWLKDRQLTTIITGERGERSLTRHGLEEYVADCVILLDHRVSDQLTTRRMRIVKYRGSSHGTNEYPFLITPSGLSVLPITSLRLDHAISRQRESTGVPGLDDMLGGRGFYRGSSLLVSGGPGTGKTNLAAHFAHAACARGKRALFISYEESGPQILRNTRSIGLDLQGWLRRGLLQIHSTRPTVYGLERHLVHLHDQIDQFDPHVVVMDPIEGISSSRDAQELKPTLIRVLDYLKHRGTTALFTTATQSSGEDDSQWGMSSLMDAWLWLRNVEINGERNRALYVLKSRGMAHSNQVREFAITDRGFQFFGPCVASGRVLTGSTDGNAQPQKGRNP